MKKILVIVAVLTFLAGMAYAAALDDGLTRDVYAHGKGRSIVSDTSVAVRIWYTGTGSNPGVTVSGGTTAAGYSTILLYENSAITTQFDTSTTTGTYDTISKLVNSINTVTGWNAAVGPDVTPDSIAFRFLRKNAAAPGNTEATGYTVLNDCSTLLTLSVGQVGVPNKVIRLRQIVDRAGGTGNHVLSVWDGTNRVWRWDVGQTPFATAAGKDCSPQTVTFVSGGTKGLACGMGNKLTVTAQWTTSTGDVSDKLAQNNISIIWDEF